MAADRTIGRTVKVKTYQALVELAQETSSYVKSSYGGIYAIAVINSFVILPVGSQRVVAIVTGLDMAEEPEANMQNRQMLVIARPRRTMWVSMIGTITQTGAGDKHFEYGVRRYPELDNPVWFASEEDLDVIFAKGHENDAEHISIGKSPIFTDYHVTIDVNRFFGKHAAILGNTGAGKSCTVTAVIKAVLERGMPNAHFVIFDTNNEYQQAFTSNQNIPLYNRLVLRNRGDQPDGLWLPHWFMNSADYQAFFRPGEGAQAPLLFKAIRTARMKATADGLLRDSLDAIEIETNRLEGFLTDPPRGNAVGFGKENVRQVTAALGKHLKDNKALAQTSRDVYLDALGKIHSSVGSNGQIDVSVSDTLRKELRVMRERLAADKLAIAATSLVGVDTPKHFDFDDFVANVFESELTRETQRDARLRSYVGTLQLRLEQARHDPRYAFLFHAQPFAYALASFLRLIIGLDPSRHFEDSPPPWANAYTQQYPEARQTHQITILDLSELASEVLENVTAVLGRLVLEFMQRIPERASFPLVLVLEEAHRYIPDRAPLERQQRARDVFEKIAKEGRKFGLSLVVASQRPSELSRTVLAQCNSFIVHRIQNPDDQDYFRSVISGINRELLDQLPALAQQQAIVMGDCVTLPLQVRIHDVSPRPRSVDPEFVRIWSNPTASPPDVETIVRRWEGDNEDDQP